MCSNPPYYLTAYGIAVKLGFRGTEEEWLRSLTAFGIAQAEGFEGTVEDWLKSLHGATFIPKVENGVLSWENSKGLDNPEPIDLYEVALGGIGRIIPFSILAKDWTEDETVNGKYRFYYDICHARITSATMSQITLDEDSLTVASECGMCPTSTSYAGYVRVKAMERPEQEIKGTCYLSAMHIPHNAEQVT